MKLSLAELKPLKSTLANLIQEKLQERERVAYIEFEKDGPEADPPEKSFDDITKELEEIRKDYRIIDSLMAKANNDNLVKWEDGDITIKEALELSIQLRGEARALKQYGNSKKIEKVYSYRSENSTYKEATFEPSKIAERALKLERKVNRLSMAIEKTNHKVEAEFPEAVKYL